MSFNQSDGASSSSVSQLLSDYDLLFSLNKRFNDYTEQDCFKLATFLDPRMGWKMLNQSKRDGII